MAMTRRFVEAAIGKGWEPYTKSHWLDFNKQRGGVIITFRGHEQHEFKCSHKVAREILNS